MAGIYFHIPFCKQFCGYCDFHRSTKLALVGAVVERMRREVADQAMWTGEREVATIYFGGGTPSLLAPEQLGSLMDAAAGVLDCRGTAEITVEANPDDITPDYARRLRAEGVNRVSLGVQSLDDGVLRLMGRRHDARRAAEAVEQLRAAGFSNISADIIFGVPVQGPGGGEYADRALERTIEGVLAMGVEHISAYHLTIEPQTRFGRMAADGRLRPVSEERSEAEYARVHARLTEVGYEHYEVSNYARAGFRSRHNSSYWTGERYLGIGPGAHSYNGIERRWCGQSVEEYAACGPRYGSERLTARDRLNEYVMVSLRRAEGMSLDTVRSRFGEQAAQRLAREAEQFVDTGMLVRGTAGNGGVSLRIPAERFLVSDTIISTLFE